MPWAVTLRADSLTDQQISALGSRLADAGISRSMSDLGYGAHITLAVYEEMDATMAQEAITSLVQNAAVIPLRCAGFGIFPGPPCCLWLAPVITSRLVGLHARLAAALPTSHPHYAGGWVPHLTIADDLPDAAAAAEAVRLLGPTPLPDAGTLARIELVRFRPVEIIWSAALAEPDAETAPALRV